MAALLTLPALLNASVVMGLVPTKGLTLPFLSYGRTSLVVSCVALGLLLGVAKRYPAHRSPASHRSQEGPWPGTG
jgi:cell division protein FtsW